jgi:hypothetical protein
VQINNQVKSTNHKSNQKERQEKKNKTSEIVQQERNEEETKSKSHKKKDILGIYKSPMRSILNLLALMVTRLARETLHASLSSIFHNALFGKATSQL